MSIHQNIFDNKVSILLWYVIVLVVLLNVIMFRVMIELVCTLDY
jgi:hypothetical protein